MKDIAIIVFLIWIFIFSGLNGAAIYTNEFEVSISFLIVMAIASLTITAFGIIFALAALILSEK